MAKHVVYIENICYKSLKNFIFNFLCDPWVLQAMCAFSAQCHSNLFVLQLNFTTRFIVLPPCPTFRPVKARFTLPKPLLVTSSSVRAYPLLMTSAYGEGFPSWYQPSEGFPYWRHPIDVTKNPLMLSSWTPPHTRPRTPSLYHRLDHPLAPVWPLFFYITTLLHLWRHHFLKFYWRPSWINLKGGPTWLIWNLYYYYGYLVNLLYSHPIVYSLSSNSR